MNKNKPGRNDPCPCGSGKKYKKCHLAEDDRAATVAYEKSGLALGEVPVEDEDDEEYPEFEMARDTAKVDSELDSVLHEIDFPDMVRLLAEYISEAELEAARFVTGFFERVWDATESLQDRNAYRDLLHRLAREQPEIFAEIGSPLLWDIIEQTVADGRQDFLGTLFADYADSAYEDPIQFLDVADGLAFYGLLDALLRGMRRGWPKIRDSKHLSPTIKERFARRGINYEVFSALEAGDPIDATELGAKIRCFENREEWEIHKCIELISVTGFETIQKEDFSASREAMRLDADLLASFRSKVNDLTHAFRAFLRMEKTVSWTHADMASAEILDIINGMAEDPFQEERPPQTAGNPKDSPAFWKDDLIRNLCPDSDTLDSYFSEKLFDLVMQEFRTCSLWMNISYWPEFLVRNKVMDQSVSQAIRASWESILEDVGDTLGDLTIPPSMEVSTPPA